MPPGGIVGLGAGHTRRRSTVLQTTARPAGRTGRTQSDQGRLKTASIPKYASGPQNARNGHAGGSLQGGTWFENPDSESGPPRGTPGSVRTSCPAAVDGVHSRFAAIAVGRTDVAAPSRTHVPFRTCWHLAMRRCRLSRGALIVMNASVCASCITRRRRLPYGGVLQRILQRVHRTQPV